MKAVCMVAHPDDCVIFGYSLMRNVPRAEWSVCYLTYQRDHERGREFKQFWHQFDIDTMFLGYQDDWRDIDLGRPSFDTNQACRDIQDVCKFADIVLTHDKAGDYGHPHHRFVHRCVELLCHPGMITFAAPGTGTHQFSIDPVDYTAENLPLHWSTIKNFHPESHRNEYTMSNNTAQELGI